MSLGPDARDLLSMADGADDPTAADQARVRAKIAARLAVAAGTGIAAGTAAKTAAASTGTAATTTLVAKIAIGVAVVSATTAGGIAYERTVHERERDPAPVVVPMQPSSRPSAIPGREIPDPPPAATAAETVTALPEPTPTVTAHVAVTATGNPVPKSSATATARSTVTAPSTVTPTAPVVADTVAEEAALLRAAHGHLASGDGSSAMRALDEHARRFPRGALAEEREAARVMALCAQGRASEARASASAFVASNPRSPFAAQVRRSCASKEP